MKKHANGLAVKKQTSTNGDGSHPTPTEKLGQIRDILFGQEMAKYDAGFKRLEKRIDDHHASVKRDLDRKLSELDAKVQSRLQELTKIVKEQNTAHETILREHGDILNTSIKSAIAEVKENKIERKQLSDMFKKLGAQLNE